MELDGLSNGQQQHNEQPNEVITRRQQWDVGAVAEEVMEEGNSDGNKDSNGGGNGNGNDDNES